MNQKVMKHYSDSLINQEMFYVSNFFKQCHCKFSKLEKVENTVSIIMWNHFISLSIKLSFDSIEVFVLDKMKFILYHTKKP